MLSNSKSFEVHNLKSGYLKKTENSLLFHFRMTYRWLQSTVLKSNFDSDKKESVFAAGNYFGVSPYHSRFDGFLEL
jgi:hypothetical protein